MNLAALFTTPEFKQTKKGKKHASCMAIEVPKSVMKRYARRVPTRGFSSANSSRLWRENVYTWTS
jgi:hypothetical protein